MTVALEIVFVLAVAAVGVSVALVAFGRVPARVLLAAAVGLGALGLLSAAAFGIDLVSSFADSEALLLLTGGFALAALAETALFLLVRGLRRVEELERVGEQGRARLEAWLAEHSEARKVELERMLARERANASYVLGEQERQLAEERRDLVARQAERARVELTESVSSAQERLEGRLRAWAADLDRGQRQLEQQLTELSQRQGEVVAAYDARLRADAERLEAVTEEQRKALARLREEFQRVAAAAFAGGRAEIETLAAERRRALHEVAERLRARERAMQEQIEREESEARSRLAAGLTEAERRQLSQLERVLDRSANRLSEEADRRFDAQIRESREKAAQRLSHELDRSIEQFVRQAEKEVSDRIADLALVTADRVQRRVTDVGKAAEAQHEVAAGRLRLIEERLDEALAAAEERITAFEAQIELELEAKLGALERSMRAAERE